MNAIDEYRKRLAQLAVETMVILGSITDAEKRLTETKRKVTKIYEEIDNVLDGEKHESSKPQ